MDRLNHLISVILWNAGVKLDYGKKIASNYIHKFDNLTDFCSNSIVLGEHIFEVWLCVMFDFIRKTSLHD